MPFINVETNLPASKFPEDLLKRLCTTLAAALGKPEDRMNLVHHMTPLNGTFDQAIVCVIKYNVLIFSLFCVRSCSILILFYPLEPWQIGKKGTVMSFL
uniref:D-dopachrome decarboxylase-like n=1 Tax=Sinocyclocheilus grahami TaxID=75366 RepID=A0A672K1K0_SINGR